MAMQINYRLQAGVEVRVRIKVRLWVRDMVSVKSRDKIRVRFRVTNFKFINLNNICHLS